MQVVKHLKINTTTCWAFKLQWCYSALVICVKYILINMTYNITDVKMDHLTIIIHCTIYFSNGVLCSNSVSIDITDHKIMHIWLGTNGHYSDRLAHDITWNRTANVSGQVGHNIPLDLLNEHLNKEFKSKELFAVYTHI
jgi:hypothetical protein